MDVESTEALFPETVTCPFCGGYARLKRTKNRRVSAYCSRCSSRLFLNSWPALCGYVALSKQVQQKREEWIAEMDAKAEQMKAGPRKSIEEVDRVVAKENMERAMRGDQTALSWLGQFEGGVKAFGEFVSSRSSSGVS